MAEKSHKRGEIITKEILPGDMLKLPSDIYEADVISRKKILHRGMQMVENSLIAHRTCNSAIIFVYGLSGAGKTSSLNHLFGFELIKIIDKHAADTKFVTEYVAIMESQAWRVSNLQIVFIDMPGWSDGREESQDVRNMALIDQFISNHPFLGSNIYKCYPNIVMIAINANDTRLKGENSQIVRMFRALSKLNVVDKDRSNILIILTHVNNVGKKSFKERLKEIIDIVEDLTICYLKAKPVIVYLENDYEEHELEQIGDWTILKDKTLQPKNVFDGMIQLTSKYKDEVGQEAIRLYFASRGSNRPVIRSQLKHEVIMEDQIRKWKMILGQEFSALPINEVNAALQKYAKSNPDKYSTNRLVLLMIELDAHSLTKLNTLWSMRLNQVQEELDPYKLSQLENEALLEGCGVKPYQFPDILQHMGYGIKAETGEVTTNPVLNLESDWHVQNGVSLPKSLQAVIPKNKIRVEWKRKNDDFSITENINKYVESMSQTLAKYQFQILYNIYTIRVYTSEKKILETELTPAFKQAVSALPENSVAENNLVNREYFHFFNNYGEWVIVGCECGGNLHGEVELEEKEVVNTQKHINTYIYNLLDRLDTEETTATKEKTSDSASKLDETFESFGSIKLEWEGGYLHGKPVTLNNLTAELWTRWRNSLYKNPQRLNTYSSREETSLPIHQFVSLLSIDTSTQVILAYPIYYKDELIGTHHNHLDTWKDCQPTNSNLIISDETVITKRESASIASKSLTLDIASGGFPENATVIEGTSNSHNVSDISKIKLGDKILCKDPWELKYNEVMKIHCSEEGKELEYLHFIHEHGEFLIGQKHTIVRSVSHPIEAIDMVLANNFQQGEYLLFLDKKQNRVIKSRVKDIRIEKGKGHYSLKVENGMADIAVNQVLTGDEEEACFPGNAGVSSRGGEQVRMDELKIGDYVLSIHPTTHKPVYSQVYLWAHRDPHIKAKFLHITHPQGHLHISANHLILSGDKKRPVAAHQLRVEDTIHFLSPYILQQQQLNGEERKERNYHTLISVPVLEIHSCIQMGYYAPFTKNGLIIVDSIAASVYSEISTHSLLDSSSSSLYSVASGIIHQFGIHRMGQYVLAPLRVGYKLGVGSVLSNQMDPNTHIHKYCQLLMKYISH
ncbi:hypothetical protein LOD99_15253 [Oopsacas minuta]|uniref:MACPF domain-containing protein n=1 Tax=Oopsacas minuta TaxID=111878 RepID=A0AAV7KB96_9METZ|nr:hypothetical protein LOD99_15253 [Oopsacas minuta]